MRTEWRDGNHIELLVNGDEYYPSVFEAIRQARNRVVLETFIWFEDKVGYALREVLITAAQRGVSVDATADGYGSHDLSPDFLAPMIEAGVRFHFLRSASTPVRPDAHQSVPTAAPQAGGGGRTHRLDRRYQLFRRPPE
ncbi:hypothetical protein DZS_19560 [Dickeya ananatis]